MLLDVGITLNEILQRVPNGVLIVFSSYDVKDRCVGIWKRKQVKL